MRFARLPNFKFGILIFGAGTASTDTLYLYLIPKYPKNRKKRKSIFLIQKQQLCVCFIVLAAVAPKTMIFEKNIFLDPKKRFLRKIRGPKNQRVGIGHKKGFLDPPKKNLFFTRVKCIKMY